MARTYSRPYVGIEAGPFETRTVFRSVAKPNSDTHPQFVGVVGPFKTMEGANWFAMYAGAYPNLNVTQCERAARNSREIQASQHELCDAEVKRLSDEILSKPVANEDAVPAAA